MKANAIKGMEIIIHDFFQRGKIIGCCQTHMTSSMFPCSLAERSFGNASPTKSTSNFAYSPSKLN